MSYLQTVYDPSGQPFELSERQAREALAKGFTSAPPAPRPVPLPRVEKPRQRNHRDLVEIEPS